MNYRWPQRGYWVVASSELMSLDSWPIPGANVEGVAEGETVTLPIVGCRLWISLI